jgi:hypothetical protein
MIGSLLLRGRKLRREWTNSPASSSDVNGELAIAEFQLFLAIATAFGRMSAAQAALSGPPGEKRAYFASRRHRGPWQGPLTVHARQTSSRLHPSDSESGGSFRSPPPHPQSHDRELINGMMSAARSSRPHAPTSARPAASNIQDSGAHTASEQQKSAARISHSASSVDRLSRSPQRPAHSWEGPRLRRSMVKMSPAQVGRSRSPA